MATNDNLPRVGECPDEGRSRRPGPICVARPNLSHRTREFKPGSPKPTKGHPCSGAIPRRHSHFFDRQGQFGSLDWLGGQVDDGPYRLTDQQTVHIGTNPAANFRFRILNGNKLTLTPVLTKAMVRRALAHPAKFSAASWAVSVAYAGHTWQRVPCNGRC
jgi:hypothetical protein